MRWRAGSSAMLLAVAVAAVMAATAGPVYLRSADQSLVTRALDQASPITRGITLSPEQSNGYAAPGPLRAAAETVPGGSGGRRARFGAPIVTIVSEVSVPDPSAGGAAAMELVYLSGACRSLRLVAGHCPRTPDEVVLTTRTAAAMHVRVGSRVTPSARAFSGGPSRSLAGLVVSGLARAGNPAAPQWWGNNYFSFGQGSSQKPQLDAGFLSEPGAVSYAGVAPTSDWVDMPLRPRSISASSVPGSLARLTSWSGTLETAKLIRVDTALASVLSAAGSEEHSAQTIVAVISLELLLLVLLVVYAVARATSSEREPDVRVAELRGLPRRRVARMALREPALLLVAAAPIGLGLTYLVLSAVDSRVLSASTGLDSLAVAAAVVGCAAGLGSVALGSRNILGNRRADETPEQVRQRRIRNALILDSLGLAIAVAGLVELVGQSGHANAAVSPFAYLGPGLVALGAGIVLARLLPALGLAVSRALAWSRRASLTLAARSIARRQAVARQVLVPTIATGLLVFAVAGLEVAASNHAMQAQFSVGAPVVYGVQPHPGVNLLTAVRSADPSGREAMAAAKVTTSNGTTLAVDTSRFAAVASWPATLSATTASEVARELSPPAPPPRIVPNARALEISVDAAASLSPGPDMQLALFDEQGQGEVNVDFGSVAAGSHVYRASLAGLCPSGCRLDQLLLTWAGPSRRLTPASRNRERQQANDFRLTVTGMRVVGAGAGQGASAGTGSAASAPFDALLHRRGAWRGNSSVTVTPAGSGLLLGADFERPSASPTVSSVDLPAVLPSVATSVLVGLDGTPSNPRGVLALGLDATPLNTHADTVVPALPGAGNDAAMIELGFAEAAQVGQQQDVTWQVWFHRPPSRTLLHRLERAGVTILARHDSSAVLAGIDHTGPSFGFDLYGLAAAGAALLALGALLFSVASDARRRRVELAGLSAVGVPRGTLLSSLVVESTVLSVAGAAGGTVAAALSAFFALRFLPEFPPGRVGPALDVAVPWVDVALTGLAMLVLLEIAAVVANVVLVRGIRPDLLRLSQ